MSRIIKDIEIVLPNKGSEYTSTQIREQMIKTNVYKELSGMYNINNFEIKSKVSTGSVVKIKIALTCIS